MITESMHLVSLSDAKIWAEQLGLENDEPVSRVAAWIWDNNPSIDCTYADHPIRSIEQDDFWNIADGQ